jgi:RNA pseudouridylate synthase
MIQRSMCERHIKKLYLARVHGRFPATQQEAASLRISDSSGLAQWEYSNANNCMLVDAPIETVDPANGVRQVTEAGKPARSVFQLLSYDAASEVSLLACQPITGRSHQLRVHLQWLGFPIVGDVLYGGRDIDEASRSRRMASAIDALVLSATKNVQELKVGYIPDDDAAAARHACSLCQPGDKHEASGVTAFFTPAQLLESGHSIDLHASRYQIGILASKKNHVVEVLDLQVDNPTWAKAVQSTSIPWLTTLIE